MDKSEIAADDNTDKPTIKAIIFDLDGTLLDTEALSCRSVIDSFELINAPLKSGVRSSLRSQGNLLPWDLKRRILGLRGSEWVPIVLGYAQENWGVEFPLDWKDGCQNRSSNASSEVNERKVVVDKFWRAWEERLNELCEEVQACSGAPELVEGLRSAHLPLAIATSSRADSVAKKRRKHEVMFQSFQEIVTGDDENVHNGKPAPDIYLEAAKRLGVNPSECLVFEDALTGAQSGKAAGCRVVAVPDSRMEKEVFMDIADEVLVDMWQFCGKKWGIPFQMQKKSN